MFHEIPFERVKKQYPELLAVIIEKKAKKTDLTFEHVFVTIRV